ncbi:hypothetical protein BHM03_00056209 [Ensete ventricosum]|nr:hypothetical protein BHM03_00056209 [Ensete ventricosum]
MGGHMHTVCIQRWLATARPPTRVTGHGLATYKGRPAVAKLPTRGGHPRARPNVASPIASRGGGAGRRGGRPLARQLPIIKGSHRLHRDSGDGGAMTVKED